MCGSMADIQLRLLRLGEEKKKKEEEREKYNGLPYSIGKKKAVIIIAEFMCLAFYGTRLFGSLVTLVPDPQELLNRHVG